MDIYINCKNDYNHRLPYMKIYRQKRQCRLLDLITTINPYLRPGAIYPYLRPVTTHQNL